MEIHGGCLCRKVRYRITAEPIAMRLCWCRSCQYLGAGNVITIEGELRDYQSIAASGNTMHRRFCPACGTQLFSESEARPHLIIVRNGTLDDTELLVPSATIWTAEAPEWAWIDESLRQHAGQPPPVA